MLAPLIGFMHKPAAVGGGSVAVALASDGRDSADQSTYDFTGQALGSGDLFILHETARYTSGGGAVPSAVTVDGQALTMLSQYTLLSNQSHSWWIGTHSGGSTGTVQLAYGATRTEANFHLLAASGLSQTLIGSGDNGENASNANDISASLDCPAGGVILAAAGRFPSSISGLATVSAQLSSIVSAHEVFADAQTGRTVTATRSGSISSKYISAISLGAAA